LSAALSSGQLVVRYFGDVGLGIRPIYDIRFLMGIYYLVMQQSPPKASTEMMFS